MTRIGIAFWLFAVSAAQAACPRTIEQEFRASLAARDETRIMAAVTQARACLGDPKPETPERYAPFPAQSPALSSAQRLDLIRQYWDQAPSHMWWLAREPQTGPAAPAALRVPAAALRGLVTAAQQDPARKEQYLAWAEKTAAYLMLAQAQGGADVFPVPAWEGASNDRVRQLTDRFIKKARAAGTLDSVTRNGWIIDDGGQGDLNFDNGLAGEALLVLHAVRPDPAYLDSARRAGQWAMRQPLSSNFNYNGFSAALIARLYAATGEAAYRDEAVARLTLGVLPGMIPDGPYRGHWIDPHNERLVYRLIMIRQIATVASVLKPKDPALGPIVDALWTAVMATELQQRTANGLAHSAETVKAHCDIGPSIPIPSRIDDVHPHAIAEILGANKRRPPAHDPMAFHCALSQ